MAWGFKFRDGNNVPILEITDSTPRLISVQTVSVPGSGTVTANVPSVATPSNSVVMTDTNAAATVTSAGVVTVTGSSETAGTTNLRVFTVDL
jgi:hypothetical protein